MKLSIHHDGILPHLLYLPEQYSSEKPWPLIVFLHGSGERGLDPNLVRKYALPKAIDDGLELAAIVYAPQCPDLHSWNELYESVLTGANAICKQYAVDMSRRYLTGFSMGARGVWVIGAKDVNAFAAYAPVAGRIPYEGFLDEVARLKDKALWVFHGARDSAVPVENSDSIVAKLREIGASKLHYTRYDEAGHGECSNWTYSNPELYQWFLNQKG